MSGIKMRINKSESAKCDCCGCEKEKALDMYDIRLGMDQAFVITICDVCNEELFKKTLRASCMTNSRIKNSSDISIIKARNRRKYDLT